MPLANVCLQHPDTAGMILSVKSIRYTRHAKNRMRLHKVPESEVESAIGQPAYSEPSGEDRINAWTGGSGKFLRVTYKDEENMLLVISAVRKKKGWR
jgi:hypothetical protein